MRWPTRTELVPAVVILAVLGLVAAFVFLQPTFTTGSIYVSGPQVYTRERLVNDRYREDAWLLDELKGSTLLAFGVTTRLSTNNVSTASGTLHINIDQTPPVAAAAEAPPAGTGAPHATVDISPFDRFKALGAYREQVRTQIIENQLDDRHDLRGNSLYRLRFDAAVLPGSNTRHSAKITVSILPPEGLLGEKVTNASNKQALHQEEVKLVGLGNLNRLDAGEQKEVWERLYIRWLDSLDKQFDSGRRALQRAYINERFTPNDYDLLLESVRDGVRAPETWQSLQQLRQKLATVEAARDLLDANRDLLDKIERGDAGLFTPNAETQRTLAQVPDGVRAPQPGGDSGGSQSLPSRDRSPHGDGQGRERAAGPAWLLCCVRDAVRGEYPGRPEDPASADAGTEGGPRLRRPRHLWQLDRARRACDAPAEHHPRILYG